MLQSPLLRLLSSYYGSTSLQLHTVTLNKNGKFGLIRLFWNLFLAVTSYHYIVIVVFNKSTATRALPDNNSTESSRQLYPNLTAKPLYAISFFLVKLLLPLAIILHVAYFALLSITTTSSPGLLQLLDLLTILSRKQQQTQKKLKLNKKPFHWAVFLLILTLDHSFHIVVHFTYTDSLPDLSNLWSLLHYYTAYYVVQQHNFIIMGLVDYYKLTTLQALQQLLAKTTQSNQIQSSIEVQIDSVEPVINQLATLNQALNRRLSFPLLISVVMQLYANLIIFSTAVINGRLQFVQLLYILFFAVHFAYIAALQYRIEGMLAKLERHLTDQSDLIGQLNITDQPEAMKKCFYHKPRNTMALFRAKHVIGVHRRHFELKVFRLFSINPQFFLSTIVFIAGYVVLIAQTTTV